MSDSRSTLLHGFLDLCLLSLLADGDDYGMSLTQRLADAGLGAIPGGTLYPALLRLEKGGLVEARRRSSTSGPARKYFSLTPAGRTELLRRQGEWRSFRTALERVLDASAAANETSCGSGRRS